MGIGGAWDQPTIKHEAIITARKAILAALELGIIHFDHANIYTIGKAEKVFGVILKKFLDLENLSKYKQKLVRK